jgi:hypothetical protein
LNHDVYDLIADYVQENLEAFKESGGSEEVAGVETQKDMVKRTTDKLKTLRSIYKGANPRLYQPY